jgi:hypothetical protein
MSLCLRTTAAASVIAFAIGAAPTANAQAAQSQPFHHRHVIARRPVASRGDDVIVPTGRSYLDPGTSADVGTEDRYSYDTEHYEFRGEGPDFTRNTAGFELLPGPRDPPGQQAPLFVFNTPGYAKGVR